MFDGTCRAGAVLGGPGLSHRPRRGSDPCAAAGRWRRLLPHRAPPGDGLAPGRFGPIASTTPPHGGRDAAFVGKCRNFSICEVATTGRRDDRTALDTVACCRSAIACLFCPS